jgi:hypothetical protein
MRIQDDFFIKDLSLYTMGKKLVFFGKHMVRGNTFDPIASLYLYCCVPKNTFVTCVLLIAYMNIEFRRILTGSK